MEIEARFINLTQAMVEEKLKSFGAAKAFESLFQEWLFFYKGNPDWDDNHKRIRVRTDGAKTWLTYKANATWAVDSTEEVELEVSNAEQAVRLMNATGIPLQRFQEKKRIEYRIEDITFDLDFWPKIPMVLEIESSSKENVKKGATLLGLNWQDAIFVDQKVLHERYYNINLNELSEYKFSD
jgi:adenylate cyclase, class 2